MLNRIIVVESLLTLLLWASCLSGQERSGAALPAGLQAFPVILQESLESGKTLVGTKIHARLTVATLVNRVVIPKDALFSGVVIESMAKSSESQARLAVRMDSVQWRDGSAPIKAYLTPLYYPKTTETGPNLQYKPPEPPNATWNGQGQYPNSGSRVYQPFPSGDSDASAAAIPNTTSTATSNITVRMRDVVLAPTADGGIALVCKGNNLKFDKLTTYVLAAASQ